MTRSSTVPAAVSISTRQSRSSATSRQHKACSFYGAPGVIAARGNGKGLPGLSELLMSESYRVHDTGRKDHAGKGIIDISGDVKWGWRVGPGQPS